MQSLTHTTGYLLKNSIEEILLTPNEITTKIVNYEKKENKDELNRLKTENSPFAHWFEKEDAYWQKQEETYLKIESWIRANSDKLSTWQVAGPLHYGMTLDQMKEAIKKKFQEMERTGKLMTEEELLKKYNRQDFYPLSGRGGNNLTRIWGAEYLKSNISECDNLDVADHYLIVDSLELEVQVWHGEYPYLSVINNAHILSKRIEGIGSAWDYRFSKKLDELKYRDFKDFGNIICDTHGIGWIVDTELKGFDPPDIDSDKYLIRDYLKKRFKVLSGDDYRTLFQTFKISVSL